MSDLLRVENLIVDFHLASGRTTAVNGISFEVQRGEAFGIVGESGSGKTVTALTCMGLLDPPARVRDGGVWFAGRNLVTLHESEWALVRGRQLAMVFQEPMTSLNPVLTVGEQIAEVYIQHVGASKDQALRQAAAMLDRVHLPHAVETLRRYPYELSGGMRQRVLLAAALACEPELLIADEPTTALDVTVQAQILKLLQEIQADSGMGMILISHNLGVVAQVCTRVAVMYAGDIVEEGPAVEILRSPTHPYTAGLIESLPRRGRALRTIGGSICDLRAPPSGCRFHPRCPRAEAVCQIEIPESERPGARRRVTCHFPLAAPAPTSE